MHYYSKLSIGLATYINYNTHFLLSNNQLLMNKVQFSSLETLFHMESHISHLTLMVLELLELDERDA